jgi:hypothetical protein
MCCEVPGVSSGVDTILFGYGIYLDHPSSPWDMNVLIEIGIKSSGRQ